MRRFDEWKAGGVSAGRRRHVQGQMNGLEAAYESEVLRPRLLAGELVHYEYEALKLRLADKTWYTGDFLVETVAGFLESHEVKGHWEEHNRVKWKVAAEHHSWLRFFAITKEGGLWIVEPAFIEDRPFAAAYGTVRGSRSQGVGALAGAAGARGRREPADSKNV